MIVIRNAFRLKFGKAREATVLVKELVAIQQRAGAKFTPRILTDVTGPFYTLVLELSINNLAAWESEAPRIMGEKAFQETYQKFTALVDSGSREIFKVVE